MTRIDVEAIEDEWEEDHHLLARRSRELSQAARETIDRWTRHGSSRSTGAA
jgi:hypothetical protein